jgi:hypothetical protein
MDCQIGKERFRNAFACNFVRKWKHIINMTMFGAAA